MKAIKDNPILWIGGALAAIAVFAPPPFSIIAAVVGIGALALILICAIISASLS